MSELPGVSSRPRSRPGLWPVLVLVVAFAGIGNGARAQLVDDPGAPVERAAAIEHATVFLQLIDQGKFTETWPKTGPILRSMSTRGEWETTLQGMRMPIGKLQGRELAGAGFTAKIDGAPPGHYYVVFFTSRYARVTVEEKVILNLVKGRWNVEGYFMTPIPPPKP